MPSVNFYVEQCCVNAVLLHKKAFYSLCFVLNIAFCVKLLEKMSEIDEKNSRFHCNFENVMI